MIRFLSLALIYASAAAAQTDARDAIIPPPTERITMMVGEGSLVRLGGAASNLFIADVCVADVQAVSPSLAFLTAHRAGQTSFFALDDAEDVVASYQIIVIRADRRNPAIEGMRADGSENAPAAPSDC